ncbi:MAG: hypothetical protein SGPRY_003157 [Prymnesium sp.]
MTFVVQSVVGLCYFLVRSNATLRLSLILILSLFGLVCGFSLASSCCSRKHLSAERILSHAVCSASRREVGTRSQQAAPPLQKAPVAVSERAEHVGEQRFAEGGTDSVADAAGSRLTVRAVEMKPVEKSLIAFLISTRGLPQQSNDAILAYFGSDGVASLIARAIDGGSEEARSRCKLYMCSYYSSLPYPLATGCRAERITSPVATVLVLLAFLYLHRKARGTLHNTSPAQTAHHTCDLTSALIKSRASSSARSQSLKSHCTLIPPTSHPLFRLY